jgi:GTP-binding protein
VWVDEVVVELDAGRGGDGVASFRREKFVPRGGPDGGRGGDGGSIWLEARAEQNTLAGFRYRPHYRAERGRNGGGADKTGRRGEDLVLAVPLGTVAIDSETGETLGDLTGENQRLLVAQGGRGGRGNAAFATAANRAPRNRELGAPGETRKLRLELRLLADVGLVGFPNAGKSTFISRVSAARPKIADYPFTTLVPHLGVVDVGPDASFVMADVPGLIPGASQGVGLGDRFLRHLSRTAYLVYFIDVSEASMRDPVSDLRSLRSEIEAYGQGMEQKPAAVAANKIDALSDRARLDSLAREARDLGLPFFALSAATGEGCREMAAELYRLVGAEPERRGVSSGPEGPSSPRTALSPSAGRASASPKREAAGVVPRGTEEKTEGTANKEHR